MGTLTLRLVYSRLPVFALRLFVEAGGHVLCPFSGLDPTHHGVRPARIQIEDFTLVLRTSRPRDVAIALHQRTTVDVTGLNRTPGSFASSFLNVAYELSAA